MLVSKSQGMVTAHSSSSVTSTGAAEVENNQDTAAAAEEGNGGFSRTTAAVVVMNDEDLLSAANKEIEEECLLAAARLLRQVQDQSLLTDQHRQMLLVAQDMEESCEDLLDDPDDSWILQSHYEPSSKEEDDDNKTQQHRQRDTAIYYRISSSRLESRIDCVMETSLLVPFLSVLNETDLYASWIPSWTVPVTLGIQTSQKLAQLSRAHQIVHITCRVPWPMSTRDVILRATAADDIASHHAILVRMKGVETTSSTTSSSVSTVIIPPPAKSVVRCDFEGAILIRPYCPPSSDSGENTTAAGNKKKGEENQVMVSFKMFVDPHLSVIPTPILNFVTRTVLGTMWNMLLHVAEGVRDGTRPLHATAIVQRPDLYDWIRQRIQVLLGKIITTAATTETTTTTNTSAATITTTTSTTATTSVSEAPMVAPQESPSANGNPVVLRPLALS